MSRILLTGSNGFIGSHIYEKYKQQGHQVTRLDRTHINCTSPDTYLCDLGVISYCNLVEILKDVDIVNHHAAQIDVRASIKSPILDIQQNVMITLKLLEASIQAGVKRFIFASSGGAINNSELPDSPYGISKLTAEKYLNFYNKHHNLETVILRYSNVYGPRQTGGVIPIFISKLLKNQPITINGDGSQTRDFIFVKDIAEVNNLALTCNSGTYNISSGHSISISQLTEELTKLCNSNSEIINGSAIEGEIIDSILTPNSPNNWTSSVSFKDGLKQTIEYYK